MAKAPKPRRVTRPKWLDIRVLGGILLIIASVAAGAKILGSADRTHPVWAAAADLQAGTVLRQADLTVAEVNLGSAAAGYVDTASDLTGMVLSRPITGGELLPAAAVDQPDEGRVVSVAVAPDRIAPGVAHGSVIDLYLVTGRSAVLGEEVRTELLLAGATVQDLIAPSSGGLSGAVSNRYQLALLLTPNDAESLVARLPHGEVLVVLHSAEGGS